MAACGHGVGSHNDYEQNSHDHQRGKRDAGPFVRKSTEASRRRALSRCRTMTRTISLTIVFTLQQRPRATCPWPRLEKFGVFLLK